jgi:hypothetical protein
MEVINYRICHSKVQRGHGSHVRSIFALQIRKRHHRGMDGNIGHTCKYLQKDVISHI